MNIYVGNIPYTTDEQELSELFEQFGEVYSVKILTDRETGRPRGFGFVEMEQNGGRQAIEELNEYEMNERKLVVNEAREKRDKRSNFKKRY